MTYRKRPMESLLNGTRRKLRIDRLATRVEQIQMVLMDNDGVLTDGGIVFGDKGAEYRVFDVKDGLGIKLLQEAGLKVGIISGLASKALENRARALGVDELHINVSDKRVVYEKIKEKHGLQDVQIAYIGDDLIDIPIMIRCGLAVAVADAHKEIRKIAHLITQASGGHGAVREFIDYLLKVQGHWKSVVGKYYSLQ